VKRSKWPVISMAVLLLGVAAAMPAPAAPELSFGPLVAAVGSQATLELRIAGTAEAYTGVNVEFVLPDGVTVLAVERGPALPETFAVDAYSFAEDGQNIQTAVAYGTPDAAATGDGCVLQFTLQISSDLSAIGLEDLEFVHAQVTMVASGIAGADWQTSEAHTALNGTLTISKYGDLPMLVVSPAGATIPATGGAISFSVTNAGLGGFEWNASVVGAPGWLRLTSPGSGTSGQGFFIAVDPHSGFVPRTASVIVEAGGVLGSPLTIVINQGINEEPVLTVEPGVLATACDSGLSEVSVSNAGAGTLTWKARVISGIDWASITSATEGTGNAAITIARLPNLHASARTAIIEVSAEGAEGSPVYVTLTQQPPPVLAVNPLEQAMGSAGGPCEFAVANTGGGVLAWSARVVAGGEWLHLATGAAGVDAGAVEVEAAANPNPDARVGRIQISAQGALGSPVEAIVIQAGDATPLLSVTPGARTVPPDATTTEFSVTNAGNGTMHWNASVVSGGTWASIHSGTSGIDEGAISVSCQRNDSASSRTAVIRVEAEGADGSPKELTITQQERQPLRLTSPNGGEWWKRGSSHVITWTSDPRIASVSLVLMKGGNVSRMITLSTDNSGTHAWTIPTDTEPGRDYQVQVMSVTDPTIHDECDGDFAINCPPEPPGNLTATQTERSRVVLTWNAVDSATAYEVYRSGPEDDEPVLIATVGGTQYVDKDVRAWEHAGCSGTRNTYYYSVRTINGCDASDFSEEVEGTPLSLLKSAPVARVYEKALPRPSDAGKEWPVAQDAVLAIRLRSADAIDPKSVWATVACESECGGAVAWIPAGDADDARDGWVVYTGDKPWSAGELLTMTAGGATYAGADIEPVTYTFRVADDDTAEPSPVLWQPPYELFDATALDLAREGNERIAVREPGAVDVPALEDGLGAVYEIGPSQAWDVPQRVWLPLPPGRNPEEVNVYYYYAGDGAAEWYGAENVEGWFVADSLLAAEIDGTTYLGFLVRHGGTVQLGPYMRDSALEESMLPQGTRGDLWVVALVLALLAVRRRGRAHI